MHNQYSMETILLIIIIIKDPKFINNSEETRIMTSKSSKLL